MPQVTILRRELATRFPSPEQVEEVIAVTYCTQMVPPRDVNLPLEGYRRATPDELAVNIRYQYLPASPESEQRERVAIEEDIHRAVAARPTTFEL